jgi:hypothetical protein
MYEPNDRRAVRREILRRDRLLLKGKREGESQRAIHAAEDISQRP